MIRSVASLLTLSLLYSCANISTSRYKTTVLNNTQGEVKNHPKGASVRILTNNSFSKKTKLFMAELIIPSKGKVPLHRDPSDEYLFVLEGQGTIWIDDKSYDLKAGSFVYMPAMSKVRFQSTGKKPFRVFQVFAPKGPENKYNNWK